MIDFVRGTALMARRGAANMQVLYDALRPALIAVQSLDELCELVDILKHEVRRLLLSN